MNRFDDVKPVIEALFRQRYEEVVTGEVVSQLGEKKKTTKPRLLLLCRPMSARNVLSSGSLNLLYVENDHQRVKLKQAFAVDRLVDVSHDGSFDATFNFGASGMLSVSFESHIQREMFVAAVKRLRDAHQSKSGLYRGMDASMGAIRGVLTDSIEAQAEADAASRVRKLRQEKRRVFSTEEEQHLLKHMGHATFDDIKQFQETLLIRQKKAELTSLDTLVNSTANWEEVRDQVTDLVEEVEEVEKRIKQYSTHLLSKKSVIQQIEHDNNTLQRKQQNLEQLYVMMADLRDQLSLGANTMSLLTRLYRQKDEQLVQFFSEGDNAHQLSEAMKHMQQVLHNPKLEANFPIAAVTERKTYFLEQRRRIAQRSKSYILSTISNYETKYLADKTRFSHSDSLVWRLHSELSSRLLSISDIINALAHIDMEGFTTTLRKYRTSMQKVYALEIYRFFKSMRRQVKKVNSWKGPFLLGSTESHEDAIAMRMETAQAGETPRMWRGTPSPSPALTPRAMHFDDDRDSNAGSRGGGGGSVFSGHSSAAGHALKIDFPSANFADVELYADPNLLHGMEAKAAASSVVSSLKSLSPSSTSGGGYVRPDLAFAMSIQSVMVAILHEEYLLGTCFDLKDLRTTEEEAEEASSAAGGLRGGGASGDHVSDEDEDGAKGAAAQERQERAMLLKESLLELFSGDKTLALGEEPVHRVAAEVKSPAGVGPNDLGLPPRYPIPPRAPRSPRLSEASGANGEEDDEVDPAQRRLLRNNFLIRQMVEMARFFTEKCDRIYAIPAMCMVKAYRYRKGRPAQSSFCQALLKELETVVSGAVMRFVADQTESIARCKRKYLTKPTALLNCFAKMPAFILRLEVVHRSLAADVVDHTGYATIVSSLVNQSFDALDYVTNIKTAGEDGKDAKPHKLGELIQQKLNYALDGIEVDAQSIKRGFVQQYRHHAFFCAFYSTLPSNSYAAELLQDLFDSSKLKRDRYEELYLTRILLVHDFPVFGVFALSAEDLLQTYSKEELRHHRALAPDAVKKVLDRLEKEVRSGVKDSAARIKKHFLRDVNPNCNEVSFHRTLLQRTWQHFSQLLLQKIDFLTQLLTWSMYHDLKMPLTHDDVKGMFSAF